MTPRRARQSLLLSGFLLGGSALVLEAAPASALITLKVQEVGADLVVTGSGSAKTTTLTLDSSSSTASNVLNQFEIYAGPAAFSDGNVNLWRGLSGPATIGTEPTVFEYPTNDSLLSFGDLFGIITSSTPADIRLVLPISYVSGASLSGQTTYGDLTLARAGLTNGQTLTWTWGSGSADETLRIEIGTPASVPAPLPITGAAAAFHFLQRLRRRSRSLHRAANAAVGSPC